jgi:UDP-3-O-[3-hydroxymyristoyl] glucosamine N-acyltransferase
LELTNTVGKVCIIYFFSVRCGRNFKKTFGMKLDRPHTVQEIAALLEASFVGSPDHLITGINEIHMVEPGDLVFVDHPKYYDKALKSAATTILIDQEVDCPEGKALIISKQPFDDFNRINKHFKPTTWQLNHPIGQGCEIDESARIYPNVFVGNNVKIGKNVVLYPGVFISDGCEIGDNVIVGPNTVIGHYAFYYKKKADGYDRMYAVGTVRLQKGVEIGALCTIDAGVTGVTNIGEGTKIDNQVHIGHDTSIGAHCLIAANVGVAGCVRIQDRVTLWGQVGIASDVTIGEGAIILAQSGVSKNLAGGTTYFGSPCSEVREKFREMAALRKLPSLLDRFE